MTGAESLGNDPCSLLNRSPAAFKKLWLSTSSTEEDTNYPYIAEDGIPVTYYTHLTRGSPSLEHTILATPDTSSTFALKSFLSGGPGPAAHALTVDSSKDYTLFSNVVLKEGSAIQTIVDTYFVTKLGLTNYTFPSGSSPLISKDQLWKSSDENDEGSIISSPESVLGKLFKAGLLLKKSDIYSTTNNNCLINLLRNEQSDTNTDDQKREKISLECRNLRFFGAFVAEYCFYKTRYDFLLKKFFEYYTKTNYTPCSKSTNSIKNLFTVSSGNDLNQFSNTSSGTTISQADYLNCLAYHMAFLNTRITDMIRLLSEINAYYDVAFRSVQTILNDDSADGSMEQLRRKIQSLKESSKSASSYLGEEQFRKGAVEYTSQKNRYSNILLSLYAFLNIAAISMVFHIARK